MGNNDSKGKGDEGEREGSHVRSPPTFSVVVAPKSDENGGQM